MHPTAPACPHYPMHTSMGSLAGCGGCGIMPVLVRVRWINHSTPSTQPTRHLPTNGASIHRTPTSTLMHQRTKGTTCTTLDSTCLMVNNTVHMPRPPPEASCPVRNHRRGWPQGVDVHVGATVRWVVLCVLTTLSYNAGYWNRAIRTKLCSQGTSTSGRHNITIPQEP